MRQAGALLLCLAIGGCFSPHVVNGTVTCAADGSCPKGFVCGSDNHCWRLGTGPKPTGGNGQDAGAPSSKDGPDAASGDPAHCTNGVKDGDETGKDCAGSCSTRCPKGEGCGTDADCQSGLCNQKTKTCADGPCSNDVLDGDETDVDCGGPKCAPCDLGKNCKVNGDCKQSICNTKTHLCVGSTCENGEKDGTETDLDCGGTCPVKCRDGQACVSMSDCAQGVCTNNKCYSSHCDDGSRNEDETDVDCGGPTCKPCATDRSCKTGSDCSSSFCNDMTKKCVKTSCEDAILDGNETDIDCGGSCPDRCADQQRCKSASDCMAKAVCDPSSASCCTPTVTQCSAAQQCGAILNNCHQTILCGNNGNCPNSGYTCNSMNRCCLTQAAACSGGKQCGSVSDGCGGTITCGACDSDHECTTNRCCLTQAAACRPNAAGAWACGLHSDGCGGNKDCGSQPSPDCGCVDGYWKCATVPGPI